MKKRAFTNFLQDQTPTSKNYINPTAKTKPFTKEQPQKQNIKDMTINDRNVRMDFPLLFQHYERLFLI